MTGTTKGEEHRKKLLNMQKLEREGAANCSDASSRTTSRPPSRQKSRGPAPEQQWCNNVADTLLKLKLEKVKPEGGDATKRAVKNQSPKVQNVNPSLARTASSAREGPSKAKTDLSKHKPGYDVRASKKWRNTSRSSGTSSVTTPKQQQQQCLYNTNSLSSISMDSALSGHVFMKSKGFSWKSKIPPIYKEIKTVMQPSLPTTGNEETFAAIPKLVAYATRLWEKEQEAEAALTAQVKRDNSNEEIT